MPRRVALLLALVCAPVALTAQGTLSTQGLGFPPGQLSTRAVTMGGGSGEADPLSPLNPAAISMLVTPILAMQAEPEFRVLRVGGQSQKTTVSRFPLFLGNLPASSRWTIGLSASTLFDRTWSTATRDTQFLAGGSDTVAASVAQLSAGSVSDLRMAFAYTAASWIRFGVAAHVYTGMDALRTIRAFDDTVRFVTDTQRTTLSFGGHAVSFGVLAQRPRIGAVGMSYRRGGPLGTYLGSERTGVAKAPDHFGVSVLYIGITGTTLALRAATDSWSRLAGISPTLVAHESWDIGLGADVQGPTFGSGVVGLRAGARWRTLPFSATGTPVREQTFSGGLGIPFARSRAQIDLGVLRSSRTGGGPANTTEGAWTVSSGFSLRP